MRARTLLAAALLGLAGTLVSTASAAATPTCADAAVPLTVEVGHGLNWNDAH